VFHRPLIGGLLFFVLIIVCGLLYLEHVKHTTEKEITKTKASLPQRETISPVQQNSQSELPDLDLVKQTEAPTIEAPHAYDIISEETDVTSADDIDRTVPTDILDIPLVDEAPKIKDFKTTPDGYPLTPYWDYPEADQNDWSYDHKLIDHVLVKLWRQGLRDIAGGSIDHDTNRVRAHYLNTLYVKWEEVEHPNGGRVNIITRALGAGDVNWDRKGPFDLPPAGVHLIDINSPEGQGIDPFTFLTSKELPE
jgi:hypothetical protein